MMAKCEFHESKLVNGRLVYCGAKTKPNEIYCEAHHKRMYLKKRPEKEVTFQFLDPRQKF